MKSLLIHLRCLVMTILIFSLFAPFHIVDAANILAREKSIEFSDKFKERHRVQGYLYKYIFMITKVIKQKSILNINSE